MQCNYSACLLYCDSVLKDLVLALLRLRMIKYASAEVPKVKC